MKYGYFDDINREYVITRPDTPLPWINYIGSEEFFGIISNTAGGYAFYQDARLRRLTRYRYNNIPMDNNGRYIYVKDGNTAWNPMWKPMRVALDRYECRHGMGYTKIQGEKNGLEITITFFIPPGYRNEIWDVKVHNKSTKIKDIRLWSLIEWCLWEAYDDMTNFQRNFSTGEVEVEDGIIYHKTEYRERRNHYGYFACSHPVSGFDTSRDAFAGFYNGLDCPQVISDGHCKNSITHGWSPVGVHQVDMELKADQEQSLFFLLGYAENPKDKKFIKPGVIFKTEAQRVFKEFSVKGSVAKSFKNFNHYWENLLANYQAETDDEIVNRMVNSWNQYQCMVTFNLSRSASFYESGIGRGMGFRDSNQDILGFVHMIPERARTRILDLAATQLLDGTCYHQYQPLTKKGNSDIGGGFNDDPLWLVISTAAYIRETGDLNILNAITGFADIEDSSATLLDHLEISIQYILNNRGPHNLPLIGHADWNDCLNLNCFSETPGESFQLAGDFDKGTTAESLMIAGMFCYACQDMIDIYNYLGKKDKAEKCSAYAEEMRRNVYKSGWDGDWFLRAYDANGNKVGSHENKEGQIFIESQGWCILGKIGLDNGYAEKALASVNKKLATENGIILQQPAFQTYHIELGEISSYPPGYKENAGIFTHNNTWIQIAESMLGNGNQAMEYYKSICPANKESQIEIYRSEPYCYSQMTAGRDAPTPGEAKNSWLSGTAAWSFVVISQYILGVRPEFNGLRIDPCIPREWKSIRITRKFQNALYNIHVNNPDGVSRGVKTILVDGKEIGGAVIPSYSDGKEHNVQVTLG
ncbi:MAG: hypothetical protein JXR46_07785 [Calditrichaceae bacterium]|nr:hypothetical protein [Calditrichaceae bacterium]